MTLWLILTAMIAIASVFTAAPFIRRQERKRMSVGSGLAVFRDQLKEIDAEAAQGVLDAVQADAARSEIKRRMLRVEGVTDADAPGLTNGERIFAAVAVTGVVVLGSVGLFALTADLEPAGSPPAVRGVSDVQTLERMWGRSPGQDVAAATSPATAPSPGPIAPGGTRSLPSVDDLIQRLITRLQRNPNDAEGWRMLGWSYFSTEHYSEAAQAYEHAIELNPQSADYRDGRMEALLRAAKGVVTDDVRAAMDDTLKLYPGDPRARYIRGLALDQGGDRAGAEKEWKALLQDLDPNDPWAKEVSQKIAGAEPVAPAPASTSGVPIAPRGPSAEDVRAAEAMSPAARTAMVQGMVGSLAQRLEASPRDAEGWQRLIRSYAVLGDKDKARQAAGSAAKAFSDDPAEIGRITALVQELGLGR